MKNNPCKNCICGVDEYCTCEKLSIYEAYQQGRADAIDNINDSIREIYKCQFYCVADMCENDMCENNMCIDCVYDAIQKSLEQLKEKK